MKRFILGIVLLLTVGILADSEPPTLSIRAFGGVDESTNPLNLKPGQAAICRNWDLGQNPGMLQVREGISKYTIGVTGVTGKEDYCGLFAYYPCRGCRRLGQIGWTPG